MRLIALVICMIGLVIGILEAFSLGDFEGVAILGAGLLVVVALTGKLLAFG